MGYILRKIIKNKLKDKINLKKDYFEKEEFDIHINKCDRNIILKSAIGNNCDIAQETNKQVIKKGKKIKNIHKRPY